MEFALFRRTAASSGQWQRPGKGLKLERALVARATAGSRGFADIFHTFREVAVPCGNPGAASLALERAERPRRSWTGWPCGESRRPRHTDKPPVRQPRNFGIRRERPGSLPIRLRVLHARSRFNDRQQPSGCGGGAMPLERSGMAKTRRLLLRRESFTFLTSATASGRAGIGPRRLVGLAGPGRLAPPSLRLSESTPGSAATRAWRWPARSNCEAEPHCRN